MQAAQDFRRGGGLPRSTADHECTWDILGSTDVQSGAGTVRRRGSDERTWRALWGGVRGFLIWSSGLSSREGPVQCRGPGRPRVQGVTGCKSSRAVVGLMFLIDLRPVAAEYGPGKGRGEFTAWLEGRWIRREAVSEAEFRRPNLEASWALSTVPMPANSYSSPELTWTKNTLSLCDDSMRHIFCS